MSLDSEVLTARIQAYKEKSRKCRNWEKMVRPCNCSGHVDDKSLTLLFISARH